MPIFLHENIPVSFISVPFCPLYSRGRGADALDGDNGDRAFGVAGRAGTLAGHLSAELVHRRQETRGRLGAPGDLRGRRAVERSNAAALLAFPEWPAAFLAADAPAQRFDLGGNFRPRRRGGAGGLGAGRSKRRGGAKRLCRDWRARSARRIGRSAVLLPSRSKHCRVHDSRLVAWHCIT